MPFIETFKVLRPVICVDVCYLKAEYKVQSFAAICIDGQNELVLMAFAVADKEE